MWSEVNNMEEWLRQSHKKDYEQAHKFLKVLDIEQLIKASEKVQSLCVNVKHDNSYEHHLPLKDLSKSAFDMSNWDLPEKTADEVAELLENLYHYYEMMFVLRYYTANGDYVREGNDFVCEVLPPWLVFPLYDGFSIWWRHSGAEDYMKIFFGYRDLLSDKELEEYKKTYPFPEYLENNSFMLNEMNYALETGKI